MTTLRIALVWSLNRNATLLQAAEDAKCNIRRDLVLELLDALTVQRLDSQIGLHKVRVDLEQTLSGLLDAWVFGVEA